MDATHRRTKAINVLALVAMLFSLVGGALAPVSPAALAAPHPAPPPAPAQAAPVAPLADPTSVTIAGSLQSELGCPGDWQPDCANTHLAYDADDDVWQQSYPVPAGDWEYKAALNDSWAENYGPNATFNSPNNITMTLAVSTTVKFYYDHKTHWVADNVNKVIAVAPGNFQSELGCAGDWDPSCLRSWLQDPDGDGIYTFSTKTLPAGNYEGKVAINESWDESYGPGGVPGPDNIPFAVSAGDTVNFIYDPVSHVLTINVVTPARTIALVGDLQSELGCAGDWDPACAATELDLDKGDNVWSKSFNVPPGDWLYKVAANNSWDENYGGPFPDGNIPLSIPTRRAATDVKFYFDDHSKWVTDNFNDVIATAVGSFQSELGCTGGGANGDWLPDCLRSWLQDPDNDGIYTFATTVLAPGAYEGKVAINEGWGENYGVNGELNGPNYGFTVNNIGDKVTFTYDPGTHLLDIAVAQVLPVDPSTLVQPPVRDPIQNDVFYFVMPDRFDNGSPANDTGGLVGDRLVTGFDPTDKGFYHGGDIAGLLGKLEYLDNLGVTAIWMTPMFKNRPVQGTAPDISAGYHGYWVTDFTQFDPHFGTNAELETLIDEAHTRGIKVFFDIILNHTADILQFEENEYLYRSKADFPYRDAGGTVFDDRDYVGTGTFPPLDPTVSFPYTPVTPPEFTGVKVPAWLNNPNFYHNRGNSSFAGENSLYGDFFGLDDLFTEHPDVVTGMTDIHKYWVENFDIDGFRIDTVKHVNAEFWQEFTPAILESAAGAGKPNFFAFGEVYSANEQLLSHYTTWADMQAVLDFRFQAQARGYASQGASAADLGAMFAKDDYFTDEDSNVYALPTFLGNHDMGRIGYFLKTDNVGADDADLLARDVLAHGLMYFARGVPVVYYGDEQGFVGDGNDKDARQDMMPSQVDSYNDDDLIGTDATTADANFDETHSLYTTLTDFATVRAAHPALRSGAQIQRYADSGPGVYAFSRMDRTEKVEYVLAFNNGAVVGVANVPTFYGANQAFNLLHVEGGAADAVLNTNPNGELPVRVPAKGFVIYQAVAPVDLGNLAPEVAFDTLADNEEKVLGFQNLDGNQVPDRLEVGVTLSGNGYNEVTFAVRETGTQTFTVIGVDDNPPYRVFYDASQWPAGTQLDFMAAVDSRNGRYNGAYVTGVMPKYQAGGGGGGVTYDHVVIHYQRPGNDYGDHTTGDYNDFWGLHLWGSGLDAGEATDWNAPKPFLGEDDWGRFAWVQLSDARQDINFILHKGDAKDPDNSPDRKFNPATDGPEIWLKEGDVNVYLSQAAAQAFVTIHYHRPDGVYDGWGLHLWGDAIADGAGTEWGSPRPQDGSDAYGAFWTVPIKDATKAVNFIIHKGDEKDPGPDGSMVPEKTPAVWIRSLNETIFQQWCAANDKAVFHYHRPAGDFGDYTSANGADFWGLHSWGDAPDPGWATPHRPVGSNLFGQRFELPLINAKKLVNYIFHRGDTKDPGPDQSLDIPKWGCEVWQPQGADPANPYILPILRGAAAAGDLSKAKAHWIDENTIAWDVKFNPDYSYNLNYAMDGGIVLSGTELVGGQVIPLLHDPQGLTDAQKAKWPHLASFGAFKLPSQSLGMVPEILKGQFVVAAGTPGFAADATGVQIPGVLDDLYTYDGPLGLIWNGDIPTLRLWAPTARKVMVQVGSPDAVRTGTVAPIALTPEIQGAWVITGDATWKGQTYLYDVEVYVPSTGQVEHNQVTDPYAVALNMNSALGWIVDLNDAALKPAGWEPMAKPPLTAPEDITVYEIHVRDFSVNDPSVPEALRGKFKAFTLPDSNGMNHLKALAQAGLSHLHLLPVFDIATINEDPSQRVEPNIPLTATAASPEQQAAVTAVADQDAFNWGYDPYHYNAPEGSYSTDPNGTTRILEFREMVQALHAAGLRVVMDVVYNHTNGYGQADKSVLDKIVPGYYYRLNLDGAVETSTCCPNTATEHAMMEKLMVDSVTLWATQYGIDSFRFDLMGHHMKENMLAVQQAVNAIDPSIYLYGEGWNFGEVANNARGVNATQFNMAGTGIGTFSDRLRDAVRGGGPFDGFDDLVKNQGFISGLWYDPNELNATATVTAFNELMLSADQIRVGLAGNLADYQFVDRSGNLVTGAQVDYNGSPAGYTQDPQEQIVYVDKHDNQTLFDINAYKLPLTTSKADRVRAQNLGLDFTVLAQGVPFLHAGGDLLRSKAMDRDSYNSGDWFNKLDFTYQDNNFAIGLPVAEKNQDNWYLIGPRLGDPNLKPGNAEIVSNAQHLRELLMLRKSSPLFRMETEADIMARLKFHNTGTAQTPGLIVMELDDTVDNQPDRNGVLADLDPARERVVVLFNVTDDPVSYTLASLTGKVLQLHPVQASSADPVVRTATFDSSGGVFAIPPRTTAVFVDALPVAVNDATSTLQPQAVVINVLANDLDPAGGGLTVVGVTTPTNGVAVVNPDMTVTYTPNPGFQVGADAFGYLARDVNGGTNTAMVIVIVSPLDYTAKPPQVTPVDPAVGQTVVMTGAKGTVSVELPAGFYTGTVTPEDVLFLTYSELITPTPNVALPPNSLSFAGILFTLDMFLNNVHLQPYVFPVPVTITISYDPVVLNGLDPASLTIYYWNGAAWANDGITIVNNDTANSRITFLLAHLSQFAAFGTAPTALEVVDEPTLDKRLYLPVVTQ